MVMLIGVCCALLGADLSDAGKKELATLQGKWQVVRIDAVANVYDRETSQQELVLEFKGEKLLVNDNDAAEVVAIHADTSPRCLDLRRKDSGSDHPDEGIFKLDGDTLVISIFIGGTRERPANFDAPTKDGLLLVKLKKK